MRHLRLRISALDSGQHLVGLYLLSLFGQRLPERPPAAEAQVHLGTRDQRPVPLATMTRLPRPTVAVWIVRSPLAACAGRYFVE